MSLSEYSGLAKIGAKIAIKYRWDMLIGIMSTPISLMIYYFLWSSIFSYTGKEIIRGFNLNGMISYYAISMIVGFFTWSEVDKWLEHDINKGHLIKGMIRPVGIISWYLNFEAGINLYNIMTQMIPIFAIGFILFKIPIAGILTFAGFFASIAFAFLIYFGLAFLLGLSAFWLKKITGLRRVKRTIVAFIGGGFIPVAFFPGWLQKISSFLPFEYARSVPILIYQQKIPIIKSLSLQIIWIAVIYLIIHFVSKKAMKKCASVGL